MAKLLSHVSSLVPLSLFLFLLISSEMPMTEAKLCPRRSKTWSGPCLISGNCARECKTLQKAVHGACHAQFPGFACFCYFNC